MQEFEHIAHWRKTGEILKQSQRIREEARQAREQARAEIERAKRLRQAAMPTSPGQPGKENEG